VVIDLFAAAYLTKNVVKKLSSGQNLRKGFFMFFCECSNSLRFTGVFAEVWDVKSGIGERSSARIEGLDHVA